MSKSQILGVLSSINLHMGCVVTTIEAWMLSLAELIELIDNIIKLRAKTIEDNGELFLLFLEVHDHPEEGWNDVVLSVAKENGIHFLFKFLLVDLFLMSWVNIVILFTWISLMIFIIILDLKSIIPSDAKLLFGSLWQSETLTKFVVQVLEFCARASCLCEVLSKSRASLPISKSNKLVHLRSVTYSTSWSLFPFSSTTSGCKMSM